VTAQSLQSESPWHRRYVAVAAFLRGRRRRVSELAREAALDKTQIACVAAVLMIAVPAILAIAIDLNLAIWARGLDLEVRRIFLFITSFGNSQPYLLSLAAGAVMCVLVALTGPVAWRRVLRWWAQACLFVFASMASAGLLVHVIKVIVGRTRPRVYFNEGIYAAFPFTFGSAYASYPSGHTVTIVALAAAVGMLWRPALAILAPLALLVAASRVVLGAHYAGDTFAGCGLAVITTIWLRWWFAQHLLAFAITDGGRIVVAWPTKPAAPSAN
jgi:membrane-associated phospholipid phosphatase